jgi:cytochrome c553
MQFARFVALFGVSALAWASGNQDAGPQGVPPPWAYGFVDPPAHVSGTPAATAPPSNNTAAATDTRLRSLPGSTLQFTRAQIRDPFGPADWFPGDHPVMPPIVAHGRRPNIMACSLCHLPNGKGRPENAPIAGLPVSYFIDQLHSFKNGTRKSADPRKSNTNLMIAAASNMTDAEIKAAAEYFNSMKWTPWIRVVETERAPKSRMSGGMFMAIEGGGQELLGQRILEMPEDTEAAEVLRNPRVGFVAYVPVGSIAKGKDLATTGAGGKTLVCSTCHGVGLHGTDKLPGLAGRSPSYIARQMFDIKAGTRKDAAAQLMKPVVAHLTDEDLIAIAAYVSSLSP